jgi:hypothetical protein
MARTAPAPVGAGSGFYSLRRSRIGPDLVAGALPMGYQVRPWLRSVCYWWPSPMIGDGMQNMALTVQLKRRGPFWCCKWGMTQCCDFVR